MPGIKRIPGAADLAHEGEPGSWVSDATRERFMAAYERVFARWPQPCEEFDARRRRAHAGARLPSASRPDPVVLLACAGATGPLVPARGSAGRRRPGLRDRHARRRKPQRPAGPDDSSGVLRRLAG